MNTHESIDTTEEIEVQHEPEVLPALKRPGKLREKLLIATLLAVIGAWSVAEFQQRSLQVSAAPLVEQALKENISPDVEAASKLTVARETPLFGTPVAKVEVFIRKAGGADDPIGGIEYEYALENGKWQLKNSGGCTSEECRLRGKEAFSKK